MEYLVKFLEQVVYYICERPTIWAIAVAVLIVGLIFCLVAGVSDGNKKSTPVGEVGSLLLISAIVALVCCFLIWVVIPGSYQAGNPLEVWRLVAVTADVLLFVAIVIIYLVNMFFDIL